MRPDGAVVVGERVVGRVPGGHRAHPPAGPEPRPDQRGATTASIRSSGTIPLQSRWPMFEESESTGRGCPRRARARSSPRPALDPVRLVEAPLQLGRLAIEAIGELAVGARPRARARRRGPSRRRRSPAPRTERSGRARTSRRGEALRVVRVLPRLDVGARGRLSASGTPRTRRRRGSPQRSIHSERAHRRLAQRAHERGVARPAPDLREQDEVERRRVERPVVGGEPRARGLPAPDLVDDLARLGVDRRVVLARLQLRELLSAVARARGRRGASGGT